MKKMDTNELVEWQIIDPENGLVMPWWTHPFLNELKTWDLGKTNWLEIGGGRSTAWLRSRCRFVDTIEANVQWAERAVKDCVENNLYHAKGRIITAGIDLPDGVQERKQEFFDLFPDDVKYDIVSVDGIWRYECLQWALDHFKGRGGIIIADNWQQDYVWISPVAEELMKPYKIHRHEQPDHTNHEGKKWNTSYWVIPK
jgi:hypothetical protein